MRKHLVTQKKSVPSRGQNSGGERERESVVDERTRTKFIFQELNPRDGGNEGVSGASEAESDLNFIL